MGTTLSGTTPQSTYPALIKIGDNSALSATLNTLSDGAGNDLPMQVSTSIVNFTGNVGVGTTTPTAKLNIVDNVGGTGNALLISHPSAPATLSYNPTASALTLSKGYSYLAINTYGGGLNALTLGSGGPQGYLDLKENGTTYTSLSGTSTGNAGYSYFLSQLGVGTATTLGAKMNIKGSGSTSATTSLLVQNSVGNKVFSITDDENILIGLGTNGGYKLDVNGTSNIRGSLRMGEASVAGLIRSHPSVPMNFGGGAWDNVFTFTQINQGAFQSSGTNQSLIRASINQAELSTTNYGSVFLSVGTLTNSGGTPIYNSFESKQTINCSGGTTIYRGFYHNPTLTLTTGVAHRAIETVTGDVLLGTTSGKVGIGTSSPDKLLTVGSPNYAGWINGEPTIKFNQDLGVFGSLSIAGDSSILYLWRSGAPANGSTISSNYTGSGGSLRLGVTSRTDVNIMQNNGDVTIGNNITTLGARLGIKGSGSTSATTSLLVQNSGGNTALQITDDRTITTSGTLTNLTTTAVLANGLGLTASSMGSYTSTAIYKTGGGEGQIDIAHYNAYTSNGLTIREFFGTGQNLYTLATKFELRILGGFSTSNGNNTVGNTLWMEPIYNITGQTGTILRGIYYNPTLTSLTGTTHYGIQTTSGGAYINTTTPQASACLQADSTTQGFLPPRMTTAQKLAIYSPAVGLMVFDTDLGRPCFYNGAWVTL